VNAFSFPGVGNIHFGVDRVENLPDDVISLDDTCKTVVLISDAGVAKVGLVKRIKLILAHSGFDVIEFTDITGEPRSKDVDAATAIVRRCDNACIIGLGGGSAIDVAKLAAVIAADDRPVEDYALSAHPFPAPGYKRIMIPTTAGTGSEVTRSAVFTTHDKCKVWTWGHELTPELVILDPRLTVSLPVHVTAASGLDALVHAIEACTCRQRNPFIDSYGLQAIRLVKQHLISAIKNPADMNARSCMQLAATLAGIAFANTGTAAAHAVGHALATLADIPHGRAVAIGLDAILEWNAEALPDVFDSVAEALCPQGGRRGVAPAFRSLIEQTGLKRSLNEKNIDPKILAAAMMSKENIPMLDNNALPITSDDALELAGRILSH
jgi:alcohol dehydrogenase class IV